MWWPLQNTDKTLDKHFGYILGVIVRLEDLFTPKFYTDCISLMIKSVWWSEIFSWIWIHFQVSYKVL